jgi:hypothetical protein
MKTLFRAVLTACALAIGSTAGVGSANADTLLYRNDFVLGTDYLGAAITASSYITTTTTGDLSSFTLSNYDVVVYANQNQSLPGGDLAALNAYIVGGGKVIFTDWTQNPGFLGGQVYTGNVNQTSIITVNAPFDAGITTPLAVTNPGWGVFSMGLSGAVVAATFANGDAAILVGNGGRTIVNGFLSDTVASQQLYTNELNSFAADAAVPVPAALPLFATGLGIVAFFARRRTRKTVAA